MNNKPIKNPFWYVFGPLLVYWIVGICVSIGTACVLVIGNVDEFAKVISGIDTGSADAMTMPALFSILKIVNEKKKKMHRCQRKQPGLNIYFC